MASKRTGSNSDQPCPASPANDSIRGRCGNTIFEAPAIWDDPLAKVKIVTPEGSAIAVSAQDLLQFVFDAYVMPQKRMKAERLGWREGLIG